MIKQFPQEGHMNSIQTSLFAVLHRFVSRTEGQDLVEYSLVFSLIAFGCVTGMGYLATGINTVFSSTTTLLTTNIT
jgi:Flp pilus assembly pilin Flp